MSIFKAIKKSLLVISIVFIIIGYYLIKNGVDSLDFVLTLLAIGLIVAAIFNIIRYFVLKKRSKSSDLVYGLIYLALGVILYYTKSQLRGVSIIAFGTLIVVSGILKVQDYIDAKRIGVYNFSLNITLFIILCAIGTLIIVNPFNEKVLYIFTGSGLIFTGVVDIFSNIFLAIKLTHYENMIEKGIDPNAKKDDYPEGKFTRIDVEDTNSNN